MSTRSVLVGDVMKIFLTVVATFIVTTYLHTRTTSIEKLTLTSVEVSKPNISSKSVQQDYFSQEEMLYFTTGIGNHTKHQHRLTDFVRSQLAKPSRKFLETYKGWPKVDHSLYLASPMIDKVMKGKRNGFFIECGAADGIYQSTSAFFELARNWTGLLIEGNLHLRPKLLGMGRNAHVLNACLSTTSKPMWAKFNNAFAVGGLESFVGNVNKAVITPVTCYPLSSILDAIGRNHIDLFILDVQGVEVEILKTINFKKYRIDVLIMEHELFPADAAASAKRIVEYRKFFEDTGLYQEIKLKGPSNTFNRFDILVHRKDFEAGSVTM